MTKAVISGYYGYKNFGDETILSVLIEHLKTLNVDVTVLTSDVEFTSKTYNVSTVNHFDLKAVIKEIRTCNTLISGGGSLLQDVTSLKSLVYYLFIICTALFLHKKVIIFAQGIGPLNRIISKILVKSILKYCDYVSVRDEKSHYLLNNWNIKSELLCDPVFSLNLQPVEKNCAIGVQLREFKSLNYNLLQKLALFINAKFSDKNIKIFSLQKTQDYELSKKFETIIKTINPNIKTEIVTQNITEELSKLEYLIAMRYHAILVAIKAGVRTCAINYDIKVENLAKDTGIPIISTEASESFEIIYQKLISLDTNKLLQYADSKQFDWTSFDRILETSANNNN